MIVLFFLFPTSLAARSSSCSSDVSDLARPLDPAHHVPLGLHRPPSRLIYGQNRCHAGKLTQFSLLSSLFPLPPLVVRVVVVGVGGS